jgi:hypothetical protein
LIGNAPCGAPLMRHACGSTNETGRHADGGAGDALAWVGGELLVGSFPIILPAVKKRSKSMSA